mmetsp:Transcript_36249/g.76170  ORF Transcript_36249/g.76170 Transcript_36249/m.76170 type:complete len:258 (+) Transcript_36249:41-814(+)
MRITGQHRNMVFLFLVAVIASSFCVDAFQPQLESIRPKLHPLKSSVHSSLATRRYVITTITNASPLLLLPQKVLAKGDSLDMTNYQAVWTNPKHPNGYRVLFGDNQKATLLLLDESSDDVERVIPAQVKVVPGQETKLIFDFGLGTNNNVEGTFTRARDGTRIISFEDGKYWINKKYEGPIGVFKDSANSNRVIVIQQVKGSDCVVQLRDGDEVTTLTAKAGNTFVFDFPDKGKVTASFNMTRRTLTFEDGTVWTKY